jgi:hypothetical protein
MAIKITDNFQVNIKNPIDNRFVVGSQSIPGGVGSIYPTPFYAYRDDISSNMGFVYPGLRIWDFNDNLPYVWTGTTWSNENLTGASVLDSGTPGFSAGGGYRNYITKFYDTSTVLTKSFLFENNVNVSLDDEVGGTMLVNPNSSGGAGFPSLNSLPGSIPSGLHVKGRIRTNTGFVGSGSYIHNINAANINGGPAVGSPGRLALQWINTNPRGIANPSPTNTNPIYVLTTNGSNLSTIWQDILNVAPVYLPTNLGTTNQGAVSLYSGTNPSSQLYEFFSLVSSGLQIDSGTNGGGSVRIESKPAVNVGGGSASVYKGLDGNKIHEFKTINSNFMNITQTSDVVNLNSNITSSSLQVNPNGPHGITIEIPASFEGTDYYVNGNYPLEVNGVPNVELGTRSKPFRTLDRCINKILNRPSGANAGGPLGHANASPPTNLSTINSGNPWPKWHNRNGEEIRVVIQSYIFAYENLAINRVTYRLENGRIYIPKDVNIEYLIDMKELTNTVTRNSNGSLPYNIETRIEGDGEIIFAGTYDIFTNWHPTRKGFFRSSGTNAFDHQGTPWYDQPVCYLHVGSKGGSINLLMERLPSLNYVPITIEDNTTQFSREGINQTGYNTGVNTLPPDYGCIQMEGRNAQFYESLFLNGTLTINAQEQHMVYGKNWGTMYSDNGRIYMRRNYQHVLFDGIEYKIEGNRDVSVFVSTGVYGSLEAGRWYRVTSIGTTPIARWLAMAVTGSWRVAVGGAVMSPQPTSTTPLSTLVDKVFQAVATPNTSINPGTGKLGVCSKRYLPSKNVYDVYLKDGAQINYGGDFYTQQNTGANQGGPDSFLCLENSSTPSTDQINNPYGVFLVNKFCSFSANSGGFVTNLLYNSYVKSIVHANYNDYSGNGVSFKNIKLESAIYNNVIKIITQTGAAWTKISRDVTFKDSFIADFFGEIKTPFSNVATKTKLGISGTIINQPGGYFNNKLPFFNTVSEANTALWPGMFYRTTDGIVRVAT